MGLGALFAALRDVAAHRLLVVCRGLAFLEADRPGRTGREAIPEPVAVVVPQKPRFPVDHTDRALVAGCRAESAPVAKAFVYLDNLSLHRCSPSVRLEYTRSFAIVLLQKQRATRKTSLRYARIEEAVVDIPGNCALFVGIKPEEATRLLSCFGTHARSYAKGARVLHEGDPIDSIGIILAGSVQVTRVDYDGNRAIIAGFGRGEIFAESLACAGVARSPVSVVAVERTDVLFIPL
jgi:hypothetical protein